MSKEELLLRKHDTVGQQSQQKNAKRQFELRYICGISEFYANI